MKRIRIISCAAVLLLTATIFSCKKLVQVFGGIDAEAPKITFPLIAVPYIDSSLEISGGSVSVPYNLDSNIRANTGGVFGIGDVSSIKLKQATITSADADDSSNLSNFKTFRMELRSNYNTVTANTPVNFFTMAFPDSIPRRNLKTYTTSTSTNDELLDYLRGSIISYGVYGRVRRKTTKTLNMSLEIILKVR